MMVRLSSICTDSISHILFAAKHNILCCTLSAQIPCMKFSFPIIKELANFGLYNFNKTPEVLFVSILVVDRWYVMPLAGDYPKSNEDQDGE